MLFLSEKDLLKQIEDSNSQNAVFYEDFKVRDSECDPFLRVHSRVLFSLMQEASAHHVNSMPAYDVLDNTSLNWILNRMSIRLSHNPKVGDTVRIYTWQSNINRLGFFRDYYLFDKEGRAFGAARSFWTILNFDVHELINPMMLFTGALDPPMSKLRALPIQPIRLRRDFADFTDKKSYGTTVAYSNLDRNHHMNNTQYIDLCRNAAALYEPGTNLVSLDINYVAELLLGENIRVDVEKKEDDIKAGENKFAIQAVNDADAVSFRALITLIDSF